MVGLVHPGSSSNSCAAGDAFEETVRCSSPALDLVIVDTTYSSGGSGRIRRALGWARTWGVPVVMASGRERRAHRVAGRDASQGRLLMLASWQSNVLSLAAKEGRRGAPKTH